MCMHGEVIVRHKDIGRCGWTHRRLASQARVVHPPSSMCFVFLPSSALFLPCSVPFPLPSFCADTPSLFLAPASSSSSSLGVKRLWQWPYAFGLLHVFVWVPALEQTETAEVNRKRTTKDRPPIRFGTFSPPEGHSAKLGEWDGEEVKRNWIC